MRYSRGRDSPLIGWLLLLPVPLATLCFGAVHPPLRAGVFGVVIAVSAAAMLRAPRQRLGHGAVAPLAGGVALTAVLTALPLLLGGTRARAVLQPGLSDAVSGLSLLSGAAPGTLALDPERGWVALGSGAATVLFCLAVAVTARSRRRRLRLAIGVVVTALAMLGLQGIHEVLGWTEIYGHSGVAAFTRYPSFGSFVSHNHGAALLAAALPLAAALAFRPHREWRLLGGGAVLALCGGLVWAQSRGGVLSGGVALAVFASIAWGRRAAIPLGVLGFASAGAVAAVGAERAALLLTQTFMPGALDPDAFGNRRSVWSEAWRLLGDAPLVGVGPGGFRDGYKLVKEDPAFFLVDHVHSEPLQALVEHGLGLGLVWVALPLLVVVIGTRHAAAVRPGRRRSLMAGWLGCVAAVLVGCLYDFPLRVGALGLVLALALGAVLASAAEPDEDTPRLRRRLTLASGAVLGVLGLASVWLPVSPLRSAPCSSLSVLWAEAQTLEEAGESPLPTVQAVASRARSCLARRPLDHEAAVWLVRAALAEALLDEARGAAQALTVAYPTLPTGWLLLAEIEERRGAREAARSAWRAGLALDLADPGRAAALVQRALGAERDPGRHASAVVPDRSDRLADGGVFLARRGEREAAQRLLERAAERDAAAVLPLAHWLLEWGEPEAASEALHRGPRTGCRVQLLRGRAARELDAYEEAGAAFRRARAVCTSPADQRQADLGAARVRLALKDRAAFVEVAAVLMRYPDHHGLRRELIRSLHRAGRYDESVRHLDMLVLAGVATAADLRAIDRITRGLPPL